MKPEIEKIIDLWKQFAEEIKKYQPDERMVKMNPNYEPLKIVRINGEYILQIDLNVFEEKKQSLSLTAEEIDSL